MKISDISAYNGNNEPNRASKLRRDPQNLQTSQKIPSNDEYPQNSPYESIILDPVKIFVGQVPHSFNEEDLQKIFERFGQIIRTQIVRDRTSGAHKGILLPLFSPIKSGCGFVTFMESKSAEEAIEVYHNKMTLPGVFFTLFFSMFCVSR